MKYRSVLENGNWQRIDDDAKSRQKCFVRNGSAYAWARWNKNRWVYYPRGSNENLDFRPTEYRV